MVLIHFFVHYLFLDGIINVSLFYVLFFQKTNSPLLPFLPLAALLSRSPTDPSSTPSQQRSSTVNLFCRQAYEETTAEKPAMPQPKT